MTTTRRAIAEYELLDHGIENSQYFQGCCTAFTDYEHVSTGCGNDFAEAVDDALEGLSPEWDTAGMEKRILADYLPGKRKLPTKPRVTSKHGDDCDYYVSIRVK